MMRWNIPKLSSKILIEKMLVLFENRRELHSKVTEDVTEHVTEIYFGLRVTGDGRP